MSVTDRAMHLDIADLNKRMSELQRRVNRKLVEVHAHELPPIRRQTGRCRMEEGHGKDCGSLRQKRLKMSSKIPCRLVCNMVMNWTS